MRIRVLGTLEVEAGGSVRPLGGPVPRRLLAALTLGAGEVVTDDELTDLVWADSLPDDPIGALRVAASRLRSGLGEDFHGVVCRRATGYQLAISAAYVDSSAFIRAVSTGRAALRAGEIDCAVRALGGALDSWRGQPWQDLGDRPSLLGPRATLTELRDAAFEELQEARIARDDASGAVAALSAAVIESPYRERRWELLALALYRMGRQTQALAELRTLRDLLDAEFGVVPGPALRDLEQRILRHDDTLLGYAWRMRCPA